MDKMACYVIVDFCPFKMRLDWWYNYVNEVADGRIFEKSSWKLFAGNQSVPDTTKKLIKAVGKTLPAARSLTDLVCYREKIAGRFGFDPLASKSALDAGYSPDSLGEAVATCVAAELLSLFAIQVFFPPRCGALARGWVEVDEEKLGFAYCTWSELLPLTLARVAAVRNRKEQLFSEKKNRKDYGNLSPAKMI
jgi:CRISPR-associated protein Csb3